MAGADRADFTFFSNTSIGQPVLRASEACALSLAQLARRLHRRERHERRPQIILSLALLGVGPFTGDELPVPAEQRVRRDDRRDLARRLTAQPYARAASFRRSSSVSRRRRRPTCRRKTRFSSIRYASTSAPPVQPADNSEQQHLEGRTSITCGSLHHTRNFPLPTKSADAWDS